MTSTVQFANATVAGGLVHVSGVIPSPDATGVEAQVADVLRQLDARLQAQGSSLARALSLHVQLRYASDFAAMNRAYAPFFAADPAVRTTVVAPPEDPRALVEISAVAAAAGTTREVIRPAGWAPSPNPYSYGIRAGDVVFLAGMVSRDGRTGEVVAGDLAAQASVIFDNASDVLQAAGLTLSDVVSARVFLTDPANFAAMNDAYRRRMPAPRPARATVIAALMNPQYLVEMTFVAMAGKRVVQPDGVVVAPDALLSPAVVAGSRVFLSGMLGVDPEADVEAQTRSTVERLGGVLRAAGADWPQVADVTLYVTDAAHGPPARRIMAEAIGRPLPAGATLVSGLVLREADVEIMLTAVTS